MRPTGRLGVLGLLAGVLILLPAAARAATFHVNSTGDAHDALPGNGVCYAGSRMGCTLRASIEEANALAGTDTVVLPTGSYTLSLGELVVTRSLSINGDDAPVIDGDDLTRVLRVQGGGNAVRVKLRDITVTRGNAGVSAGGGLWVQTGARVDLIRCVVEDNQAILMGAGVYNQGYLWVYQTSIRDNFNASGSQGGGVTATGGGIYNEDDG